MSSIQDTIRKTLASFGHTDCPEVVDELTLRVATAECKSPTGYAYIVARNWAVDQKRLVAIEERHQLRQAEEAAKQAEVERLAEVFSAAQKQFWPTAIAAIADMKIRSTLLEKQLLMVWLHFFERLSDSDLVKLFPESKRDTRDQWRRRGKVFLLPHAPAELAEVLNWRLRNF